MQINMSKLGAAASRNKVTVNIAVQDWPIQSIDAQISWLPSTNLIEKLFYCDKFPGKCTYQCTEARDLQRHMSRCRIDAVIKPIQTYYGQQRHFLSDLIENNILSEELENYQVKEIVTFDIETVVRELDDGNDLIPISIAVASTLAPIQYFERESSEPEAGLKLISDFLDYLDHLQSLYLERFDIFKKSFRYF